MCLCVDGDAKLHITGTHPRTYQSLQKSYKLAHGLRSLRIDVDVFADIAMHRVLPIDRDPWKPRAA
jgi:hypothetical protein